MECDSVFPNHLDEIFGGKSGERGFTKVGIIRNILERAGPQIGEVASATPGDENLAAQLVRMV